MTLHGAPMLAQNPMTRLRSTTNDAELNAMQGIVVAAQRRRMGQGNGDIKVAKPHMAELNVGQK